MLKREQIRCAFRYNMRAIALGDINIHVLPIIFSECSPTEFVAWTCVIQYEKGFVVDGKMCPCVFDVIRTDETTLNIKIENRK